MKEFIEKLIGRLEEAGQYHLELSEANKIDVHESHRHKSFAGVYGNAISIVKELAEEHKGGWIPCSERLPEENQIIMCSVKKEYASHRIVIQRFDNQEYWHNGIIEAWKPLPEPYKEKE